MTSCRLPPGQENERAIVASVETRDGRCHKAAPGSFLVSRSSFHPRMARQRRHQRPRRTSATACRKTVSVLSSCDGSSRELRSTHNRAVGSETHGSSAIAAHARSGVHRACYGPIRGRRPWPVPHSELPSTDHHQPDPFHGHPIVDWVAGRDRRRKPHQKFSESAFRFLAANFERCRFPPEPGEALARRRQTSSPQANVSQAG